MKCKFWVIGKTEKAYKVAVHTDDGWRDVWLPKSKVKTETEIVKIGCATRTDRYVVEVEDWIWNEKGLNAELTPTT